MTKINEAGSLLGKLHFFVWHRNEGPPPRQAGHNCLSKLSKLVQRDATGGKLFHKMNFGLTEGGCVCCLCLEGDCLGSCRINVGGRFYMSLFFIILRCEDSSVANSVRLSWTDIKTGNRTVILEQRLSR